MSTFIATKLLNDMSLCVVDAGARDGFRLLPKLHGLMEVYAFEPGAESFAALQQAYATQHPFRTVSVSPLALSDAAGTARFYQTEHAGLSSLLPPDPEGFAVHTARMPDSEAWHSGLRTRRETEVQTETLDYWVASQQLPFIDLLKIDTQGSELCILHGAAHLLRNKQVNALFIEVSFAPLYEGQCSFTEIDLWMRHCGYQLVELRTNPEKAKAMSRTSTGDKLAEALRPALVADAVYVPAELATCPHPARVAVLLAAFGYYSLSEHLLRTQHLLNAADTETLFRQLGAPTTGQRVKALLRRWLPPVVLDVYNRLKR